MTTKKILKIAVAVGARDNIVARASVRLEGTVDAGKIVTKSMKADVSAPLETKVLVGVAAVIEEMTTAGVDGVIFVPDRYIPRLLQAQKLLNKHNVVDIMVLPWMKQDKVVEAAYRKAFVVVLAALRRARNKDVMILVRGIGASLRKMALEGDEVAGFSDGEILSLDNGVTADGKVRVRNNRFKGDVAVVKDENGVVYGEIIAESLQGKAKSFVLYGREAVKAAWSLLPAVVSSSATVVEPVEVAGNF